MKYPLSTICMLVVVFLNASIAADDWLGRWFPNDPSALVDDNPTIELKSRSHSDNVQHDGKSRIPMGVSDLNCDDAHTNLTLDWEELASDYICFESKQNYSPKSYINPNLHIDHIPADYHAPHACMNESIIYDDSIPTFGMHRPLWPKYGEYLFVPKQRWIHNLEHGAIVMLYHPCANQEQVRLLKKLVRGCLYRHIITPYPLLTPERPLALVGWGSRLEISKVDPSIVITYIQKFALRGPEHTSRDGQFNYHLLYHANIVSDQNDTQLCPNINDYE